MDYRMYTGGAIAGKNVVPEIIKSLNDNGESLRGPLKMVAFETAAGTTFKLNSHTEIIAVPSTGKFYTPFSGDRFMPIYSLIFTNNFTGNIYYII